MDTHAVNRTKPLVSVIMPAWNASSTVATAVNSILSQRLRSLELIVLDDNSDDETRTIVQKLSTEDSRLRLVTVEEEDPLRIDWRGRNVNAGWRARNLGMKVARGRYITFQDADDWSLLNRLEIQVRLLQVHNLVHLTTSVFFADTDLLGRYLDVARFLGSGGYLEPAMDERALFQLAHSCRGVAGTLLPASIFCAIPFRVKSARLIRKFFYSGFDSFPGGANNSIFDARAKEFVQFRSLDEREWPSLRGRGADRDFAFHLASKFGASAHIDIPLYAWNTPTKFNTNWKVEELLREDNAGIGRFI